MIIQNKMNKHHYSNIPLYKPSEEELNKIKTVLLYSLSFISYKKLKTKYACYCSYCDKYNLYNEDQFKQIRASKLCPSCYREIRTTKQQEEFVRDFIKIDKENETFGYKVCLKWQFNKKPKLSIKQCLYTDRSEKSYRKGVVRTMYNLTDSKDAVNWHKCDTYKYLGFFYSLKNSENSYYECQKTKKLLYKSYKLPALKSNQQKLIVDNLFNIYQAFAIINFDLKTVNEVLKYNRFIKENKYDEVLEKPLNIYYLDYLSRNHIKLSDFKDYMNDCKTLGFKVEKPRNFDEKHKELADMVIELVNKDKKKALLNRYKKLINHQYIGKKLIIKPFKTSKEIINAGNILNNCIGTYINKYAKGKTDIYYLQEDKKLIACIEIKNNKLIQARQYNNIYCKNPVIKKWCIQNNFSYKGVC